MAPISAQDYCVRMGQEFKTGAFWRDCFAELLAMFFFVGSTIALVLNGSPDNPQAHAIQLAMGVAFVWTAIGYGLGDFGGAHMNNAITFACMIRKEISFLKALMYWIMQAAGSIGAAFLIYVITPEDRRGNYGNTEVPDEVEVWQAIVVEAFATIVICFAYLASYNIDRKGYVILSSLPVGLAYGLGIFLALPYTGASLNSLRSFGPSVVSTIMDGDLQYWEQHWIYWAGPMGGALVAAIFYWIFDSVDAVDHTASPYYMQSGTWSYNNYPPRRPQVMPNVTNMPRMRNDSKEVLNTPNGGSDVHKVNGVAAISGQNGMVSAYSNGQLGMLDTDYN